MSELKIDVERECEGNENMKIIDGKIMGDDHTRKIMILRKIEPPGMGGGSW